MYGFSKQSTLDFTKTPYFAKEMYFVEFLEFFCRVAFYTFYQDVDIWRNLPMQEKIDGLLAHYCKKLRLQRSFTLLPEGQSEIVEEIMDYVKAERLRKAMMPDESQGLITDSMAGGES